MTQLLDIFGFLSVLLRGFSLAFEALTIGGVIFISLIAYSLAEPGVVRGVLGWVRCSALLLVAMQTSLVAANSAILIGSTDLKLADVIGAGFWRAELLTVAGSLAIVVFARTRWWRVSGLTACVLILIGSVLTSHSCARMEYRGFLMAATLTHHLAGGAWIGGLPYLLIALRRSGVVGSSRIVARFSTLAMLSVTLLVAAGAALAFLFVRFPSAALQTTYGLMLLAKVILTAILLFLGGLNWKIVRAIRRKGDADMLPLRHFAELEIGLGFTVLLAAASLTSTPPAADVAGGRVTPHEIAERMKPRFPRLNTPSFAELAPATSLNLNERSALPGSFVPGQQQQINLAPDIAWSEYNHHWAGLVLLTIGFLAILARTFAWRWARHWPLAFLGLALFLLIRADSENWPLGPRGFWESFQVAEVAQHRLFVLLIVAFAVFEWAVQTNRVARGRAVLVFPLVCAVGGALLMTHSHSLGNVKEEFLAELSHLPLALCAVFAGWSRWLELRGSQTRIASAIWPVCFLLIGVILVLYRET
jgi:putative copper resistance protein D